MMLESFRKYLLEVRGLSMSSVRHYTTSLNTISRYCSEKMGKEVNLFSVDLCTEVTYIKEFLATDKEFIAKDEKGNRMYSAGLNRYVEFMSSDAGISVGSLNKIDVPIKVKDKKIRETTENNRNRVIAHQVIQNAGYTCEIDREHTTFISRVDDKPYFEAHHLIPLKHQDVFDYSLDCYANMASLCPNCHRKLHHGLRRDCVMILGEIYEKREVRLLASGLEVSESKFLELAV